MVIYLKHEQHGTKVAISDMEAEADEENGWVRYTLDDEQENELQPINHLQPKRRGRPPKNLQ